MAIYLEDELSFITCMRTIAPNIRSKHLGNGVEVLAWENTKYYQDYADAFPKELKELVGQITTEKNDRILFVCDSENMIRKAALYYALHKHMALYQEAAGNNWPLKGYQTDEIPEEMMVGLVDMRHGKEELLSHWNGIENLTEWHCIYGDQFGALEDRDKVNDPVWEVLFAERDCNVLLGVSNAQYASGRTAKLLCEGGYRPVFLPAETDQYYRDVAYKLFLQPAAINHLFADIEETESDFLQAEVEYEELCEESDYLNTFGMEEIETALAILKRRRGRLFRERDIAVLFERTRQAGCSLLEFLHGERRRSYKELLKMIGFTPIKELTRRRMALFSGKRKNPRLKIGGQHYLFVGNPGTGKTEGAELMHETLSGSGLVTGDFVIATRQDIVASYTGQTAPKVAALFDRAAGGTLFVDEAGFFLQKQCGGFIHEAIKEFVRYMECRRDVTVIFALYPGEKTEFMSLDPGLSSRIDQVVEFADHDVDVLFEIGTSMWKEQGYVLEEKAGQVLKDFLQEEKEKNKRSFGNGRAVRRLVELSIQERELDRMEQDDEDEEEYVMAPDLETGEAVAYSVVTLEELRRAMQTAMATDGGNESATMGFCLKNADRREQIVPFVAACQAQ